MADYGHEQTDAMLHKLELRIKRVYRQAADEMQRKLEKYLADFERKDEAKRKLVAAGKMKQRDYERWRVSQIMIGERWEEMQRELADDLQNAAELAQQMTAHAQPDVYALNRNYAACEVDLKRGVRTGFTLYNRDAVERMIRDTPDLLPPPGPKSETARRIAADRHARWNKARFNGEILQGILQGESIPQIAKRVRTVADMDSRRSVTMARTAVTNAENQGRDDSYTRASEMGIDLLREWLATHDNRTRHAHRLLDGQKVKVGEKFEVEGQKIARPGDPTAPAHLVYNCRCRVISVLPGDDNDDTYMPDGSDYEAWKNGQPVRARPKKKRKRGGKDGH